MSSTLTGDTKRAQAFVPGHITGMFRIFDMYENPLERGSIGAGFSVTAGTHTEVTIVPNPTLEIEVEYNKKRIDAHVTKTVIQMMSDHSGEQFKAFVRHDSDLPIGVGFGASGAGALGTALALGQILENPANSELAARFAHIAEVSHHTGLGDVIAQTVGGLEIRTKPGSPGIGEVLSIPIPRLKAVVLAGAPGLETSDVLTNRESRMRINKAGDRYIESLLENPNFELLVSKSRDFAEEIGLMPERVANALNDLDSNSFTHSSMIMLGDSVFCFCKDSQTKEVVELLTGHWKSSEILVTSLSETGGRVV